MTHGTWPWNNRDLLIDCDEKVFLCPETDGA